MKYVIASIIAKDEISFPDKEDKVYALGGAGIYALTGVKCWHDDVTIATGVGKDLLEDFGAWFEKNNLNTGGLIIKDKNNPHTFIEYFKDGEREETPKYGMDHFKKTEITPSELKPYFNSATGIYIFKNSDENFWNELLPIIRESKTKVMWEIAADATYFENKEWCKEIASTVDILSINLTESQNLLGLKDVESIISEFKTWDVDLTFFRLGSKGSIMITKKETVEVPSEKNVKVVDNTGGGNSSSGAVLCGYCEGRTLYECGKMGSMAAAKCLEQYGVPNIIPRLEL